MTSFAQYIRGSWVGFMSFSASSERNLVVSPLVKQSPPASLFHVREADLSDFVEERRRQLAEMEEKNGG